MKYFDTTDGSRIAYMTKGKGTPIVFIHGWSVDYHLWHNPIEDIGGSWKRQYQRIYFDLPGMGKSVGAKSIRNSDDMIKNIEEFLDFVIEDRNFILAGESYGGYLARALLAKFSKRLNGIFLLCPVVAPQGQKRILPEKVVLERDERFLSSLSNEAREEFVFLAVVQNRRIWRQYKRDIHLERLEENSEFLESQLDGSFQDDPSKMDIPFEKPVLVLLGRQDSVVGFEQQYELYKNYDRATIVISDKAGHNLQIENSALFKSLFLDFLERVESTKRSDLTSSST